VEKLGFAVGSKIKRPKQTLP